MGKRDLCTATVIISSRLLERSVHDVLKLLALRASEVAASGGSTEPPVAMGIARRILTEALSRIQDTCDTYHLAVEFFEGGHD